MVSLGNPAVSWCLEQRWRNLLFWQTEGAVKVPFHSALRRREPAGALSCSDCRVAPGGVPRLRGCPSASVVGRFEAGSKRVTDSVDESGFLHLFFFNCEKYRERNFLVKMLFDLRKLVCAK